ncbi:dihydroorotase [Methylocaldum sp. RMAD-M]|uniref:dihydroorotase n=1 Tax=Methylocaldum sp. RMAD-M TaxID=2806557 RepID=UPI000A327B64|nr:dihydroorotase [Methylocaldum sp. RMAD-M]MBP1150542.1 dihydroorotase [Methylocaldum sp. RMAD-M]MVF24703.1 dihydroorotase [Methylocaldum sp. BRCS4]
MQRLTITCPDDWHLHLRDGAAMRDVLPDSARQFSRAVIMPNLKPPVTTVADALAYRRRILDALPAGLEFDPLMTLYLTEGTSPEEIRRVAEEPEIVALKLYPAGATTHSEAGVATLEKIYPVFEAMERYDVPLLVHGEVTDAEVDIFDREKAFIDRHLTAIASRFPALRIVLEHVTTRDGVQFVRDGGPNIAATITAHHLLYNRNALLAGGVRPHFYCLPVLKRETHRLALVEAATSGNPNFFLGTDSAPHPRSQKESVCGCAGCYTARGALELYATVFESAGALDKLEAFASFNGPDFYRLPRNQAKIAIEKSEWKMPEAIPFGDDTLVPLRAGETIGWRVVERLR